MLSRSLARVSKRQSGKQLLATVSSSVDLASHQQAGLYWQCLLASRSVTTSPTSKISQVAHQDEASKLINNGHAGEGANQWTHRRDSIGSSVANYQAVANGLQPDQINQAYLDHLDVWHSVEAIKRLGYRLAQLDPLGLSLPESLGDISPISHQLIERMRTSSAIIQTQPFLATTKQPLMATSELIDAVWSIYVDQNCGLEFNHMSNQAEIDWLTGQWEKLNESQQLSSLDEQNFAKLMLESETFDHFLMAKFPTTKRYGCEGAESMLVVLDETLRLCHLGANDLNETQRTVGRIGDVIIGMAHRGRLNVLACLLGFEPMAIMQRIRGHCELDLSKAWMGSGDVLSHLSTNTRFVYGLDRHHIGLSRDTPGPINVSVLPNPSHLEVASPLVAGAARGRAHNILHGYTSSPKFSTLNQRPAHSARSRLLRQLSEAEEDPLDYKAHLQTILPIQIHGDASLAGQGIIQETLQMANLGPFCVGGSLHLVVNNQIGFTTSAQQGRSTRHCTDVFKMIEAPIIHVNAKNISSVVRVTQLALAYRQHFGKDVAIDLVCYRKLGHNELDEPAYTQPQMYAKIATSGSIPSQYCDQIGLDPLDRRQIVDEFRSRLQEAFKGADRYTGDNESYRNFKLPSEFHRDHVCTWRTGCSLATLKEVGLASVKLPPSFRAHPNLERVLISDRQRKFGAANEHSLAGVQIDWATAEILAFGSLLKQNHSVRLAGQDVARGTFSTRHAILYDQATGRAYCPLNELTRAPGANPSANSDAAATQPKTTTITTTTTTTTTTTGPLIKAQLEVAPSILSEEAALAYEFGYSVETCELSIWEAQFGDFHNTAQSIIDTLVSSSESKWLRQSPLTILLPHGLDGAGPEHSSGRLERFLQLSSSSSSNIDTDANVNWSVCYPSLPSQYFHLLRRQVLRPFRKPLIVFAPKLMFRHPDCVSKLAAFGEQATFEPVLGDEFLETNHGPDRLRKINTIVLCSGKIYFTLNELRNRHAMQNVTLLRIEELCPFPIHQLAKALRQFPSVRADRVIWFQEEHRNQGAHDFVATRLAKLANVELQYMGRPESSLPATGCSQQHAKESEQIIRDFCSLKS